MASFLGQTNMAMSALASEVAGSQLVTFEIRPKVKWSDD